MAQTFGKYEVVAELDSTPHGCVYSARPVGTARPADGAAASAARPQRELREIRYAIKVYNPTGLDLDELFWESQSFLERARTQQRTADAGNGNWAPIHEMGTSPAGAYYVTDFHPLSAASLVTGRVEIGPGVLYTIVRSVVAGLVELKETAGRSHGNLKASNVLIVSRGDVAVAGAVLTDPAPAADAAKAGEAGDLQALGELIYLLVTGRSFAEGPAWPMGPSRDWNRLGSQSAKLWRRLCNDLLDPDADGRPSSLAAVERQLPRLAPRRPRRTRRAVLATVSALIFIAVGAISMLVVQDVAARREIFEAKDHWAGPLAHALAASPARRSAMEADPDLRIVAQELAVARLDQVGRPADQGRFTLATVLPAIWNLKEFGSTQDTLAAVRRAQRGLSPVRWRQLGRIVDLQGQFENRGWAGPANYLGAAAAAARPGSADLAGGIERLTRTLALVEKDLGRANAEWSQLQDRARELDDTGDPVLRKFATLLRSSASSSVKLSDKGFENLDGLSRAAARAAELVKARVAVRVAGDYDEQRLTSALAAQFNPASLTEADVDRWLATVSAHQVRTQQINAAAEALRALTADTGREVLASKPEGDDRAEFDRQQAAVLARILAFARRPFIARDFDDGTFETERARVETEVLNLRQLARRVDPAEWLKTLPPVAKFSSRRLNEAWDAWREIAAKTAPGLARDPVRYLGLQKQTQEQWNALRLIDETFPPPPRTLAGAFADAAAAKRDQALDGLLRTGSASQLVAKREALNVAVAAYERWAAELVELAKDFPLRQDLLGPEDRPEANWTTSERAAFWNDPIVQRLVERDVQRLTNLRGLVARPRAELADIARTSQVPEIVLHAWRLLGSDSVRPAWPVLEGDLQREADLRDRIADLLRRNVKSADEQQRAAREVVLAGPVRWQRFAEAAHNPQMLASAVKLREAFGVGDDVFDRLSPAARFNLALFAARDHVKTDKAAAADADDRALKTIIGQLNKAAGELRDQRAAADLARRLATLDDREPFAERKPGDVFKLPPLGVGVPLEFRRVEPRSPGERPFYLGTTEVSLAQFTAVVEAQDAWGRVQSLVGSPQGAGAGAARRDNRRGPRTWEWERPATKMIPSVLWLSPEDSNSYPVEFRDPGNKFNRNLLGAAVGGNPSDGHPMQYVPPEAALYFAGLCGCRLPTAHEWQVAYEQFAKDVPAEKWNLRDRTWDAQRKYAAGAPPEEAAQMPDAGAYTPPKDSGAPAVATGAAAKSRPQDDHTLFFRAVDSPELGGEPFRHLVGNVAELVFDAPQAFDRFDDKAKPVAVKQFATDNASNLAVIGGSALSAPELPLTEPLKIEPGAAYADVGFRLAFTAPSRNLAERLEWVLGSQDYLWPKDAPGTRADAAQ